MKTPVFNCSWNNPRIVWERIIDFAATKQLGWSDIIIVCHMNGDECDEEETTTVGEFISKQMKQAIKMRTELFNRKTEDETLELF